MTIWVVRVGDALYVRSVRGHKGDWYRGALERHAGRIWAGGVEKDVTFVEEAGPALNDRIDAAYRTKYSRYPQHVPPILDAASRAATLRLEPRPAGA